MSSVDSTVFGIRFKTRLLVVMVGNHCSSIMNLKRLAD